MIVNELNHLNGFWAHMANEHNEQQKRDKVSTNYCKLV